MEKVHKVKLTASLPEDVALITKDAAENLRNALDHAVYACAAFLTGGNPDKAGFPFAKTAAGVKERLNSPRLDGNPPEIRPLLASFEPHQRGNALLWGLHQLRNSNTHRMLVSVGMASTTDGVMDANVITGSVRWGGSRWDMAKNECEFLRVKGAADFRFQVNIQIYGVFRDIVGFGGHEVVSTLIPIADEVERIVSAIEAETRRIIVHP